MTEQQEVVNPIIPIERYLEQYDSTLQDLDNQSRNITAQINQALGAQSLLKALQSQNIMLIDRAKLPTTPPTTLATADAQSAYRPKLVTEEDKNELA